MSVELGRAGVEDVAPGAASVVVLVDDNPDDRFMVARLIRRELPDARIVEVADPESLERVLRGERFDVLVTDYELRWSNGLEVLRAVRRLSRETPVIMFTGTGTEEVAVEAMKAGLDDYIIKSPDRLVRLTGSIRQSLVRARERAQARELRSRLERLFAAVPLGLYRTTPGGELIEANPTLAAILGLDRSEDVVGRQLDDHVGDPELARERRALLADQGALKGFRYRLVRPDGGERWVEEDASLVDPPRGAPYCEGCIQDITERRAAEQHLLALQKALERLPIGVTVSDVAGRILYVNPAEAAMRGYAPDELVGRPLAELAHDAPAEELEASALVELSPWKREQLIRRKSGSPFPAQLISDAVRNADGVVVGVVTTCEDITERKATEERLTREALYDALTGLPNRVLFRERLAQAWQHSLRHPEQVMGVLFIDLDRFKHINDWHGHAVGDAVLKEAVRRIGLVLRPEDTFARLGGDEFAVLVGGLSGVDEAVQVAERCRVALDAPLRLSDKEVSVSASVGVALNRPRYEDADGLLRDADAAMYRAKSLGRKRSVVFQPAMRQPVRRLPGIDSELRQALDRGELEVHFQPLVELATRRIHGVEALARWRHPERGLLAAETFVGAADETGLIVAIDELVLREACRRVSAHNQTLPELVLSVNLSARRLRRSALLDGIDKVLSETGLAPRLLVVEVPESAAVGDIEGSAGILRQLHGAGLGVVLDDFGKSQAAFSQLKQLPVTGLKIDRSLVAELRQDGPDVAIVEAVIGLAHRLGLSVTAVAVETPVQLGILERCGCDFVQGDLLGRIEPGLPDRALIG